MIYVLKVVHDTTKTITHAHTGVCDLTVHNEECIVKYCRGSKCDEMDVMKLQTRTQDS